MLNIHFHNISNEIYSSILVAISIDNLQQLKWDYETLQNVFKDSHYYNVYIMFELEKTTRNKVVPSLRRKLLYEQIEISPVYVNG